MRPATTFAEQYYVKFTSYEDDKTPKSDMNSSPSSKLGWICQKATERLHYI